MNLLSLLSIFPISPCLPVSYFVAYSHSPLTIIVFFRILADKLSFLYLFWVVHCWLFPWSNIKRGINFSQYICVHGTLVSNVLFLIIFIPIQQIIILCICIENTYLINKYRLHIFPSTYEPNRTILDMII